MGVKKKLKFWIKDSLLIALHKEKIFFEKKDVH